MGPRSRAEGERALEPPSRILVVDDEDHLRDGLRFNLVAAGYRVDAAADGPAAKELLTEQDYDLVVLDVMMPGEDGLSVCRWLRKRGNLTPVLMLTVRSLTEDMIEGLDSGADDYMTKPFDLRELLARVRTMLRRRRWTGDETIGSPDDVLEFEGNRIDFRTYRATTHDGRELELSHREAMLLRLLSQRPGEVVPREAILEKVWGLKGNIHTRTIDNFILRLRRYFEQNPSKPRHILSVRGVGYRFVAETASPQ